ncbi:type II secretion system major pseudopilin GspG [Hoeflea sp. TYP-13]|uniref:type II secretion system major pseudopilin GspG n=1 Tax=Hoeflea sp. TYP-13 TaxID=3230023 RepID=UPI0034C5D7E2
MIFVVRNRRRNRSAHSDVAGFTMVELLVVLAIIGLIASFAVPQVLRYLGSARSDAAGIQISNIESAMELYYIDNMKYPETEQGISALSVRPADEARWNGPYLKDADKLKDPWGNAYTYSRDENSGGIVISSLGRDGKIGGEGEDADISNTQ